MSHMEKDESMLKFAKRQVALNVCVGLLDNSPSSDWFGGEDIYIPITSGRYVLSGKNCLDQIGYNDFEVRNGNSPGFVVLISGSEPV